MEDDFRPSFGSDQTFGNLAIPVELVFKVFAELGVLYQLWAVPAVQQRRIQRAHLCICFELHAQGKKVSVLVGGHLQSAAITPFRLSGQFRYSRAHQTVASRQL